MTTHKKIYLLLIPILVLSSCSLFRKTPQKSNSYQQTANATKEKKREEENETNNWPEKLWGIDLSHYQIIEDWQKLKEHEPAFIFLKATEGTTHKDPNYANNYTSVRKHNIPVGSYHFFTYTTSGKDQARNFLSVANFKKGDLPLVLDVEFAKKMPEKAVIEKEVLSFINVVIEKTHCHPIVYCDYKFHLQYLKKCLPAKCKLWIVDYRSRPNCNWTFWQTTDKYTMAGIKGKVDFNIFNGSIKDLQQMIY